jgi:hypothetical protein
MGANAAQLAATRLMLILAVLLAACLMMAASALWLSARCRQTRIAVALAYLLTGCGFWGTLAWVPAHFVRGENLWWYVSPAWQLAILCLAEPRRSPLARPLLPEWGWFLLGAVAFTVSMLTLLTRRVAVAGEQ